MISSSCPSGHAAPSRLACRPSGPLTVATEPRLFAERLQEALETANRDIHDYALAHPELRDGHDGRTRGCPLRVLGLPRECLS